MKQPADLGPAVAIDGSLVRVYNGTGGTLNPGTLVYISSYNATLGYCQVTKARANSLTTRAMLVIGDDAIANGKFGFAVREGIVKGLATNGRTVGDKVYLSSATAGLWTASAPSTAGTFAQVVGVVTKVHASAGIIHFYPAAQVLTALPLTLNGLTADITELNLVDGQAASATFTIGAEGSNAINVGIQLKDAIGADLARRGQVGFYLAGDANGDTLAAAAPNGGYAIGTDGLLIQTPPTLTDAVLVDGNLAISATAEKFKTTQAMAYALNGVLRTKAATDNLVFTAAHVITASKFGIIALQIDAAGNVSTKVPSATQAYNDAPTALAALPAADAGKVRIGYIAIAAGVADWTANTDDLTNGSDLTTAAFTDTTESLPGTVGKSGVLVSEADGDIDITITETSTPTFYLALVLPNGALAVSGAITFA